MSEDAERDRAALDRHRLLRRRPAGAERDPAGRRAAAHGDEEVAAVLCDPDAAPVEFEEALLSTEYGEDGVQRRATLELWPDAEDGRPLRGAGTLISSVARRRPGLDSEIAFFRWSVEGREGLGHYEIVRAPMAETPPGSRPSSPTSAAS